MSLPMDAGATPGASQDCRVSSRAGVCPAPAKAPAPRARRKCCQGVLSSLRGSGRSSLVGAVGLSAYEVSPSTGPRPAVAGSRGREAERQLLRRRQRGSGLADISPAVSAMERAALHVHLPVCRLALPARQAVRALTQIDEPTHPRRGGSPRDAAACSSGRWISAQSTQWDKGRDRPPSPGPVRG